jgi:hypothetical protein
MATGITEQGFNIGSSFDGRPLFPREMSCEKRQNRGEVRSNANRETARLRSDSGRVIIDAAGARRAGLKRNLSLKMHFPSKEGKHAPKTTVKKKKSRGA